MNTATRLRIKITTLSLLTFTVLSGCDQGAMTVSEYKENPDKINSVLEQCAENPKDFLTDDKCINASAAKNQLEVESAKNQYPSLEDFQERSRKIEKEYEAERAAAADE